MFFGVLDQELIDDLLDRQRATASVTGGSTPGTGRKRPEHAGRLSQTLAQTRQHLVPPVARVPLDRGDSIRSLVGTAERLAIALPTDDVPDLI